MPAMRWMLAAVALMELTTAVTLRKSKDDGRHYSRYATDDDDQIP
jgi:hypothetical protein